MAKKAQSETTTPAQVQQDSERSPEPMDTPASSNISTAPSTAELDDTEERTRIDRVRDMRAFWGFNRIIEGLDTNEDSKPKLITHFSNSNIFSTRTIRALETLAELFTAKKERDKQMKELMLALCDRIKGRRPWRLDGELAPKWGKDAAEQDKSVREEVKNLIKAQNADFEDSEDDEHNGGGVGTVGVDNQPTVTATTSNRGKRVIEGDKPRKVRRMASEDQHSHEERRELVTAIKQNWPSPIANYLPEHAYPKNLYANQWHFQLLEALVELSRATSGWTDRVVRARLEQDFPPAKAFSLQRSLDSIKTLRDSLRSSETTRGDQDTEHTPSAPVAGPDIDDQGVQEAGDHESTTIPPPAQPEAQQSEAPQPAGKRPSSRPATPEQDMKRTKRAPTGGSAPNAPVRAATIQATSQPQRDGSETTATLLTPPGETDAAARTATIVSVPSHPDEDKLARPPQQGEVDPATASISRLDPDGTTTHQTPDRNPAAAVASNAQTHINRPATPPAQPSHADRFCQAVLAWNHARTELARAVHQANFEVQRRSNAAIAAEQEMMRIAEEVSEEVEEGQDDNV